MQTTQRTIGPARGAAWLLLGYGALGVAAQLRGPALLGAALGVLGGAAATETPGDPPGSAPLTAFFAAQPWLPWAAWLLGLALLSGGRRALPLPAAAPPAAETPPAPRPAGGERGRRVRAAVTVVLLAALLGVGAWARLNVLLPQARGLTQFPYDDEGVDAGAGQMLLQGILPYRDFFFAHPPLAAVVYTPALAYHFTPWGSPTSFMLARYLSVAYSLGVLVGLFALGGLFAQPARAPGAAQEPAASGWTAWRTPLAAGSTAALLWALDGRAVEINRKIMLDQPMILAAVLAVLAYFWAWRRPDQAADRRLLALAGLLAAVSLLIKVQGLACLAALGLDLLWRLPWRRGAGAPGQARPGDLAALAGGALAAAGLVLAPPLIVAPSQFIRMAGFFQLLRPSDGVVAPADRIANLTAIVAPGPHLLLNGPTMYLAALGFLALTGWAIRTRPAADDPARARRRLIVIWSFLSILLFTYSRSFYNHYYVQLVTPLCLLAGAIWLPLAPRPAQDRRGRGWRLAWGVALLPALALLIPTWQGLTLRYDDPIFTIVGRFAGDAVPPGTPVLTSDEQFNFMAARPPSHSATGYLIDSYGHMIALGLDLANRSWADLLTAALHGAHSDDAYAVMRRPAPQADFLARARRAALIVVHDRGKARLTPETYSTTLTLGALRDRQLRYIIVAPQKGP